MLSIEQGTWKDSERVNKWTMLLNAWIYGYPWSSDKESWLCHPLGEGSTWCLNKWITHQYEQPLILILNSSVTLDLSITYLHTQLSLYSFPRCGSRLGLEVSKEFIKGALVRYCHQWFRITCTTSCEKFVYCITSGCIVSPYDLNAHYSQPGDLINNQKPHYSCVSRLTFHTLPQR